MYQRLRSFLKLLAATAVGAAVLLDSAPAAAQERRSWPQWRGPTASGVSTETGWLDAFGMDGPKRLWQAKVGRGFSSPIVHGDRLYLFSTDPATLQVETLRCLHAESGKEVWTESYEIQSLRRSSTPLGGTPALVGDKIFTYGASMMLCCRSAKTGKLVWSKDLMKDLPGQPAPYGIQISPTPFENLIIVAALTHQTKGKALGKIMEPKGGPYPGTGGVLLAFDQETGKERWRNTEGASAWSSPVLADLDGKKTLVHLTGRYLLGIDPAEGTTRWKFDLRELGIRAEDMAASPVIHGDMIFVPIHQAYGSVANGTAGSAAFQVRDGKLTHLWQNNQWCHWFQSAAIWDGCIYAFDERSTFWCLDLATGKEKWRTKEMGTTGSSGGAFMIVAGKALAIDSRQTLRIADLTPTGVKIVSQAVIFASAAGFECETAPLLLNGLLYCRNHEQLICFDLRPERGK
jgi:outer membrane protein assembly factor BamB